MLNIAEGFGRRTDKEFNNFSGIAFGSTADVQSALYIALDRKCIDENRFNFLYEGFNETSKMLIG